MVKFFYDTPRNSMTDGTAAYVPMKDTNLHPRAISAFCRYCLFVRFWFILWVVGGLLLSLVGEPDLPRYKFFKIKFPMAGHNLFPAGIRPESKIHI